MTKILSEIKIDAPKQKVWEIVSDLGSVSVWNPALSASHYTSDAKEGVGASRRCDFPDGGYVKERAIEWNPGESFTLEIGEGTVPFTDASGTVSVKDEGDGTVVTYELDYKLKEGTPGDPAEIERQNRDELFPLILKALKHFVETGEPLPMPESSEKAA